MEVLEGATPFHVCNLGFSSIPLEGRILQEVSLKQCLAKIGKGPVERIARGPSHVHSFHKVEV